jgi:NADPH:quinone reductase-like Zn-dependent oxidoreductase
MKAIVYTHYGSPDVLQLKEVAKPVPKGNELLIKVFASTVNRTDCATVRAKPFFMRLATGLFKPNKETSGTDFAGQIEARGKDVTAFKVGDKVFGFDDSGLRSHAQYLILTDDKAVLKMPKNINYSQAAASCEGAHYAYNFINKVDIKSGQKVLVNGATGAIGSAATQLLKNLGIDVVAVCSTANIELVKAIGATRVIDYTVQDFTKEDVQYDHVFDTVGKSSFFKCKSLIKPGGAYISSELGWMWQNLFLAFIKPIIGSRKVLFPYPNDIKRTLRLIKKLTKEGKYQAVIDRSYSLEHFKEAYDYVETGQKVGNVIITLGEEL